MILAQRNGGDVPQESDFNREQINSAVHGIQELRKRWDDKLVLPVSELGKRYLRGDLRIILDCSLGHGKIFGRKRFALTIFHDVANCLRTSSCRERGIGTSRDDGEFSMLIESVHIVDDANRIVNSIVPSMVGLQTINQRDDITIRNSLYFSVVSGALVFRKRLAVDRELNGVLVVDSRLRTGKVPNEMIQARPEVMDNLSAENTETLGNTERSMIVNCFLPSLGIWVGDNWVFAVAEEFQNFVVEIEDILIGPF